MSKVMVTEQYLADTADGIRAKNGTQTEYKPSEFKGAILAIPNSYAAGDEGKVVSNGTLVSQGSDTVTQNDTYDTTLISSLTVNVSGGGATNILSGTSAPSAGQGSDGDIYLRYSDTTSIRYIKFDISQTRSSGGMQFSKLAFTDSGGNEFSYPASTSVVSSAPAYSSSESVDKIIDGSTSTKFYTSTTPSPNAPIEIIIDIGSGNQLDLTTYTNYRWYTANDTPSRDPISFALYVSEDGNDYALLDSVNNANITDSRMVLAYEGNCAGGINATHLKVSGAWQDLIGSDINDVNTGGGGGTYQGFELYTADNDGGQRRDTGFLDNKYFCCYFDDNMSYDITINGVGQTFSVIGAGAQETLATTRAVSNTPITHNNDILEGSGTVFTASHGGSGSYISVVGGWVGYPTGGTIYESASSGTVHTINLNSAHNKLLIFIGACGQIGNNTTIDINNTIYTITNIGDHYGQVGMYGAIEIDNNTDTNITVTFPVSCYHYVSIIGIG